MQGLVPAPATLAGRGFVFHAEAAANEVGGFSWKPWPCRARSSPAAAGGQIPEPWQGRVMSPAPRPSPVPKPLLGQPTPAGTLGCLPLLHSFPDCLGVPWRGWAGLPPVLLPVLWAGFGHLQHPPQCTGGSGQVGSTLLHQPYVCGFFLGKAKPTSCFGPGYSVGGKGDAWSSVS